MESLPAIVLAAPAPVQPPRAHAKPYDAIRDAMSPRSGRKPKHARIEPMPWPLHLISGWLPTRGRHAYPYNFAYEQLQIELGMGTSNGKHAKSRGDEAGAR